MSLGGAVAAPAAGASAATPTREGAREIVFMSAFSVAGGPPGLHQGGRLPRLRIVGAMRQDPADPVRKLSGSEEIRRVARSSVLATGTLACPRCAAPVSPGPAPLSPAAPLGCPYCAH